nr:hypothetical protein [Tanacetum cinerariifolium]
MTTPTVTSSTDCQMHNNIMAAGSRDRPPMLATGRYPQWGLRFLRYSDTRPNGEALRKCILRENKAHFLAENEAIHLILTGIGDEIYSTIDACQTAQEIALLRFAKEKLCPTQNDIAFCLQSSLRFASSQVAFCFKIRCVLLQVKLSFASRQVAFCFKTSCVLLQDKLRFASRQVAFCFKTSCVLSKD